MATEVKNWEGLTRSPDSPVDARDARHGSLAESQRISSSLDSGLLELGRLLWRRKRAILLFATLGAAGGLLACLVQTPLYQAKALLEIQDWNEKFLNLQELSATTSGTGTQVRSDLQTQVKILSSRSVTGTVAERLSRQGAPALETKRPPVGFGWLGELAGFASPAADRGNAIESASNSLQVRVADDSRVVEVVSDSTDPHTAAAFANGVVDEFVTRSLRSRGEAAHETEQWLGRQLQAAQAKLQDAESKLRGYAQTRGIFFTPQQHNVEQEKLQQLQQALARAQEERIALQSRQELAATHNADTLPEVLDDGPLRAYQAKLVDLRRQYAELAALYTDEHYQVKQVLAQIKTLEPVVEQERARLVSRTQNEFEAALRRENLLTRNYSAQKDLVLRQADVAVEYDILEREAQTARQLYETLLQRAKEAAVASAMSASPLRIVDRATPPPTPYRPNVPLGAAMGLLSGAFLGMVLVFVREQADQRLRRPGEAACLLGLPELGVIFQSHALGGAGLYSGSTLVLRIAWRRPETPLTVAPNKEQPRGPRRVELAVWQRKRSSYAECFRATRTSILFHQGSRGWLKSLVVTSPRPADGKSTVACNLAIAMAEVGRRTLLIDADLRKPRLHDVFGVLNTCGLSDLLQESDARLSLQTFLRDTGVPGLSLLTSGSCPSEKAALLHSARMEDLLRRLEREFGLLIIDTPPLIPASEARTLARFSNAAVVVLRLHESLREDAQLAVDLLHADGSHVLGVVVNGWKPRDRRYGYYGGRGDYTASRTAASTEKSLAASA